jgi:hypothetical protein
VGQVGLLAAAALQIFPPSRSPANGPASLLSKRCGRPSHHRLPAEVRTLALSIVRERYADFGPTLAADKLAERHGCSISRETLRGWMIADGLWQDRRHRFPCPHQPRRRSYRRHPGTTLSRSRGRLKPLSTAAVHSGGVIPEIDIWRAAQLMLKRYGDQALKESAARATELTLAGDDDGAATWRSIMEAVTQLANTTPPGPVH